TLTLAISKLAAEVGALKARIAGVDAAKELSARQEEFAEALRNSKPLKEERLEVGGRLGELQNLTKNATVARTRADTVWQNARLALSEAEAGSRLGYKKQIEQRAEHARALLALRHAWRHLPKSWRRPA
ncbi:chromosome segregation protein SMC, partial [Streptococcus danieliae]|nr:chromosome segregation protein SMC [Streptococcus danieliae]